MKLSKEAVDEGIRRKSRSELAAVYNAMSDVAESENMRIGDVRIPFLTSPLIADDSAAAGIEASLSLLMELMVRTEKLAFSSSGADIYDRLMSSLTDGGRRMVEGVDFESDFSLSRRYKRIDSFASGDSCSVIEVNQAAPLASHFHDGAQRIIKVMLDSIGIDFEPHLVCPHILKWFICEYEERFGKGSYPERIALVIEHGYPPKFTDLPGVAKDCSILSEKLCGRKLEFVVCFPYEVRLEGCSIIAKGLKCDMIWRNSVYMDSYRKQGLDISDYEKILSNGRDFLIVNSSRAWLTRTKEFFSLFADGTLFKRLNFSDKESEVLRSVIPLTVNISRNQEYDEDILKNRREWISKPADSGFGKGVVFGNAFSESDWRMLMEERRTDGFVFQRRIKPSSSSFTVFNSEGAVSEAVFEYDYCPHFINGAFHRTALARALKITGSADNEFATMNLAKGGFILPVAFA